MMGRLISDIASFDSRSGCKHISVREGSDFQGGLRGHHIDSKLRNQSDLPQEFHISWTFFLRGLKLVDSKTRYWHGRDNICCSELDEDSMPRPRILSENEIALNVDS